MATLDDRLIEYDLGLSVFTEWDNYVYFGILVVVLCLARFLYPIPLWFQLGDRFHYMFPEPSKFNFQENLITKDNKAISLSFGSFILSIGLILNGQIVAGSSDDKPKNILLVVVWGLIGILLLLVARIYNVWIIVRSKKCIESLAYDANLGVAAVETGASIGTALIIRASTSGDSVSWGEDIISTLFFFLFGQLAFTLFTLAFQFLIARIKLQKELIDGNAAVGISLGGNLIAIGYLISIPILATDSLIAFGVFIGIGIVILFLMRIATNRLVLWGEDLDKEMVKDKNWGAALIEVAMAILVVGVLNALLETDPGVIVNCD